VAAIVLTGGASVVRAASASVTISAPVVLNDISSSVPGNPTPGGNIGYTYTVTNGSGSVANHVSLSESLSPSGSVVYVNATGISCPTINPAAPPATLSCAISKLEPNASFTITVLFRTASNLALNTNVTSNIVVAFDSQTNGPSNRKTIGTDTPPRVISDPLSNSFSESITLPTDTLSAHGGGQMSDLTMPNGFVNSNIDLNDPTVGPFVGASLQNDADGTPLCSGCPTYETVIDIPRAHTFDTAGPFWDGTTPKPFNWTITLPGSLVPKGFKVTGIYHDGALLATCAVVSGAFVPNTDPLGPGICVTSLTQSSKTKTITATGLALSNGRYQFG
jgi:uncharacterized repeat protein (TIGR01451 family)